MTQGVFLFSKQSKQAKQTTRFAHANKFSGIPEQSKQKSKQTDLAKKLVRRCSHESHDQNKPKSEQCISCHAGLFGLFAWFTKKKHPLRFIMGHYNE